MTLSYRQKKKIDIVRKKVCCVLLVSEFPHALTRISIKNHEWIRGGSDFLSIKNVKILPVPPLFELLTWIHCPWAVCVIPFSSCKQIKWMPFEPLKAFYRLCQLPLVFYHIYTSVRGAFWPGYHKVCLEGRVNWLSLVKEFVKLTPKKSRYLCILNCYSDIQCLIYSRLQPEI